jgi:hypothetical protein
MSYSIQLPPRKSRNGHFSFIPPVALKGRATIWPGRNKPAPITAHETSAARMARRKAIQSRLLAERGLKSQDAIDAEWRAVHAKLLAERGLLPDGRTWEQAELDQAKRKIHIMARKSRP